MTADSTPLVPGTHHRTLRSGSRERSYLVHVPPAIQQPRPLPVVLAFHGGATDAAFMARFCGLNEKADQAGFMVVYPNGTGEFPKLLTWNAGTCCGYARRHAVDDVGFVSQIIDTLLKTLPIDAQRIYATGMSNGAMMAYRLAVEIADRLAAMAAVAGTMELEQGAPTRPVPVIHFHGTADEYVPFTGGLGPRSLSQHHFRSVEETIRRWVDFNGCRLKPVVTEMPAVAADGLQIQRREYLGGRDNTEVVLYVVEGGGHTWPGRVPRLATLGPSTQSISANDLLWEFFQRHARVV